MIDSKELYEKIDKIREEKGLTLYALGVKAGLSHNTLNSWKSTHTMPTLEVLDNLCYALGVHLCTVLYDIDEDTLSGEEIEYLSVWRKLNKQQKSAVITVMKSFASEGK